MTRRDLVDGLRTLTDKQFVDVFYEAVHGRHIYSEDVSYDAHLVLANAFRNLEGLAGAGLSNSFVPHQMKIGWTTRRSVSLASIMGCRPPVGQSSQRVPYAEARYTARSQAQCPRMSRYNLSYDPVPVPFKNPKSQDPNPKPVRVRPTFLTKD